MEPMTSCEKTGDVEEGETLELKIPAKQVPPGTRIIVQIPRCPKCGAQADYLTPVMMVIGA